MTQGLELRRLARDSTYNLIRQGWTILVGFGISILLARGLGREAAGIYTLAALLPDMLVKFLNLGVAPATVYFIGRRQANPTQLLTDNVALGVWIGLGAMLIGLGIAAFIPGWLFPNVPQPLLFLSLLLIIPLLLINFLNSIFHGMEDFRNFNLVNMAVQLFMLLLVFVFVWLMPLNTNGAMLAYLVSHILGLALLVGLLVKRYGLPARWSVLSSPGYIRNIKGYSLKSHIANVITYLNYRADNFLLNFISGVSQVGLYGIAVGISERFWIPSNAAGSVILARIANLDESDNRREQITPLTTRIVLWLSLLMAVLAVPLLIWLIPVLYSEEFRGSILPCLLLLPGTIAFNAARILSNDIAGRGKPEINLNRSAIALVVNIIANLILIPMFQAAGAAIASTISYTVLAVLTIIVYCQLTGVSWQKIILIQRDDLQRLKLFFNLSLQRLSGLGKKGT